MTKIRRSYRVIYNNDGHDVHSPQAATAEGFLNVRVRALAGSQIDAICFSTHGSFNQVKHETKVGELCTVKTDTAPINHVQTLIDGGCDCLQIVVDWARKNGLDAFWSMRMNDCHDGRLSQSLSRFKKDHPQWLVGRKEDADQHVGDDRWWAAANYGLPQIRQRALALIEEVCRNYAVDGIELDFNRHTIYFPEQLRGQPVEEQHVQMMNDLLRRVRELTNAAGARRGRPIAVMVRVLDDLDMSLHIGLDVRQWVQEHLVDILVPADYWQFTDLTECIDLGNRYDVVVYPCISATRIHGRGAWSRDASTDDLLIWRGQAMNMWDVGADGIYIFNAKPGHGPLWHEVGDPQMLVKMEKIYCDTLGSHADPDVWYGDGTRRKYGLFPIEIRSGCMNMATFHVGQDIGPADLKLCIGMQGLVDCRDFHLKLNGHEVTDWQEVSASQHRDHQLWLEARPAWDWIKRGRNDVDLTFAGSTFAHSEAVLLRTVQLHVQPR